MSEWFKEHAWKACIWRRIAGSNPVLSANLNHYHMAYFHLFIAIIAEVIATSFLKQTEGFTNLSPSIIVFVAYGVSFFFLSLSLKTIPLGISYAIWSGVGIVLISLIGYIFYKQSFDLPSIIGISLIVIGIIIIKLFSKNL